MTPRTRRALRALAAGVAAVGLVVSGTAATARPATTPQPPGYGTTLGALPAGVASRLAATAGPAAALPLTLITGDQVRVGLRADGRPEVRQVVAAPREGGREVAFHTIRRGDRVYVVPGDALPLVAGGVLDLELFNLAKLATLAAYGTAGEVPVIVGHAGDVRSARAAVGATLERRLPVINATSQAISADGSWWRQVRAADAGTARHGRATAGPLAGVERIWLNELAHIDLDDSVPQVGAPVAWDRGLDGAGVTVAVLDTGVDPTHPDLAGRIAAQEDFTGSLSGPVDGNGHGTHVAATIAGTGAASDGARRGVAPGAELIIGKVCNHFGVCPFDAIIAGMEWAVMSGARVVNMSLGSPATDGTDALSQAVNELSRATGALFVVAAGNAGPDPYTIGAPGAADEALTVAAVDDSDEMARFSSRGPRLGDDAAKPDIAAPGVGIVAARAAGTSLGSPVDAHYTAASGTSMATPHVAGAAAIVAQQHPDLTGSQIKALLMDTAADLGHDPYAQGAGLLDLALATDPTLATDGQVRFGRLTHPHRPVTDTVTYTNFSDEPVTLSLAASLSAFDGSPAPDGILTVEPAWVTVPAGGTAEVEVTLDGRVLDGDDPFGPYRGAVRATDDTGILRASTRVSAFLEPQRYEVTVEVVPPDGADDVVFQGAVVAAMDDRDHLHDDPAVLPGGPATPVSLYAGTYAVASSVAWRDDGTWHTGVAMEPEVVVTGEATVTLDLRKARPVARQLPEETETYDAWMVLDRTSATGASGVTVEISTRYGDEPHWWVVPTGPVGQGEFRFLDGSSHVPPLVTMRAVGGGPAIDLHPRYVTADAVVPGPAQAYRDGAVLRHRYVLAEVPHLDRGDAVPVVYAGRGTADEISAVDVDDALVLLTPSDICDAQCDYQALRERVGLAADAGAVGVLVAGDEGRVALGLPPTGGVICPGGPDTCPAPEPYAAVPVVAVPADEAARLVERIDRDRGRIRVTVGGEPEVPRVYAVLFADDHVPARSPERIDAGDLERVEHRVHGRRPGVVNGSGFTWGRIVPALSVQDSRELGLPRVATPRALTVLTGPPRDGAIDIFRLGTVEYAGPNLVVKPPHLDRFNVWHWPFEAQLVTADGDLTLDWNTGPRLPGPGPMAVGVDVSFGFGVCSGCREGDRFWPMMYLTGSTGAFQDTVVGLVNDIGAGWPFFGGAGCEPPTCTITLYDGTGREIPPQLIPIGFTTGPDGGVGGRPHGVDHPLDGSAGAGR